jgi:putative DNA primase/helicase
MHSDPGRIREALRFIPVGGHDERVRVAFALKAELGDAGRDLWDEWRGERGDDEAATVWKSASATGKVGIGTLFHQAKAHGWRDDGRHPLTAPADLAERKRIAAERAAQEQATIERERAEAATKAAALLKAAAPARADHPYLQRKQVAAAATMREIDAAAAAAILGYVPKAGGEALTGRLLAVPVKQGDRMATLELIDGDGRKAALAGRGTKSGGYWATAKLPDGDGAGLSLLIGEGVATVLSAAATTGRHGIAALSAGNLAAVARVMRERYPAAALVLLADLVKATGEPDRHAIEAARAVAGRVAIPDFGAARDPAAKDFNDMAVQCGAKAVKRAIEAASEPGRAEHHPGEESAPAGDFEGWPLPQPLTAKIESQPYPLDALPEGVRAAVQEVADYVKAPVPLVASSALAALSLACQAQFDVQRDRRLQGPVGLYLLTIADSGERKSTCDGYFTSAIRNYQTARQTAMQPEVRQHQADLAIWTAEREGLQAAVRDAARKSKRTDELSAKLSDLERAKPEAPRVPRLLLSDATPEALAFHLAKQWPSAGLLSSEGGAVFGSHGMSRDSAMRYLSLLNVLWDGGTHGIERRTSESYEVRGARFTVALQVQEPTLRSFIDKTGELARGTGFFARFLIAWPESTQGQRPFTEAPASWPHLDAFHRRIEAVLNQPVPMSETGALTPAMLTMTGAAKAAWIEYHDAIERELASGGELYDVKDAASKSADNAARLAALFQVFVGGGAIDVPAIEAASRIAAWHLSESRRFFGELALPAELANAARLDSWLIAHGKGATVSTRDAQRLGPVRDKQALDAALVVLTELDRARVECEGKRRRITVNPALFAGAR